MVLRQTGLKSIQEKRVTSHPSQTLQGNASTTESNQRPAPPETITCFVCGSNDTREQHAKVFCAQCHTLLENCCGD